VFDDAVKDIEHAKRALKACELVVAVSVGVEVLAIVAIPSTSRGSA
jgi:hypothetical protein